MHGLHICRSSSMVRGEGARGTVDLDMTTGVRRYVVFYGRGHSSFVTWSRLPVLLVVN